MLLGTSCNSWRWAIRDLNDHETQRIGCIPYSSKGQAGQLNDLEFYLGQILYLSEAKSLGKYLGQIFSFIKAQYLAQIKIQIDKQIGCVGVASGWGCMEPVWSEQPLAPDLRKMSQLGWKSW